MKYIVVLADGAADLPIESLGGKTPLAYASTPEIDALAPLSEIGMAHTIPEGMKPGSDTANLAVMGYDPKLYYTGRSPLEALSIGVDMASTDVAIRCNIVTVSDDDLPYEQKTIIDHSSSEISTEDAAVLLEAVRKQLEWEGYHFYVGTSYRHLLIWNRGRVVSLTPPHDILTRVVGEYLPEDPVLREMQKRSYEILNNHPINVERAKKGLNKANSVWFWGAGTRPALSSFYEKTGLKGVMISAVDLLKGIAVGAGMRNITVPGANGGLHTNYEGKARAAVNALLSENADFAYIHVEAPDEMGHQGSAERKVESIEQIDRNIVGVVRREMDASGEPYRLLLMPDHPTPVALRTHTADPIPYMLYDSTKTVSCAPAYTEEAAVKTGYEYPEGYRLMEHFTKEA
ncbi:MAG: cofactor-independent phosphoglycerate mutase [Lachnospiraceae bacterium]|nr:cofactor-independent phosphoglycerate mutase [Lachnospiraceae bacterium]